LQYLLGPALSLSRENKEGFLETAQNTEPAPNSSNLVEENTTPLNASKVRKIGVKQSILRPRPLFTQGLFFRDKILYESSGLYSNSELNSYLPLSGSYLRANKSLKFPPQFFAEGATHAKGSIFVLTWREGTLFRVDPESFEILDSVFYKGEGWGLTFDGSSLFVSDGSSSLKVKDPLTFNDTREPIIVKDGEREISELNELEYLPHEGLILANIFQSDLAAAIDPQSGQIRYYLDLAPLRSKANENHKPQHPVPNVANGLAVDDEGRLFATGKFWSLLFEIEAL
jgi:glutamine cyclotransferase